MASMTSTRVTFAASKQRLAFNSGPRRANLVIVRAQSVDVLKKIEEKKLLSTIEKLGLLSKAEKAGLSLSKIEELGLLSTAENLGLLSTAGNILVTNPATITSLALPFIIAAIASLAFIPDDTVAESVVKYTLATLSGNIAIAFLVGGNLLKSLQSDD